MIDALVARVSMAKTIVLIGIAAVFVVLGFLIVGNAEELAQQKGLDSPLLGYVIGCANILFFGGGIIVLIRQLLRSGPVMEIDGRGIVWRRWSDQMIPWDAVVRAESSSVYGQKFLCLWLYAPERYPATSIYGRLGRLNKAMGFGDIALSTQGTDQSFERLVEVVDAHLAWRDHRVGTGSAPE